MKNNSGFSLVELIVVIAIMAILVGVAVPTYSKYITKANDAKVVAQLDEVKTAAIAYGTSQGKTVAKIVVTGTTIDAYDAANATSAIFSKTQITDYLDNNWTITLTNTSYKNGATWYATDLDTTGPLVAGWNANSGS